jgi:CYTH domain-containing protein
MAVERERKFLVATGTISTVDTVFWNAPDVKAAMPLPPKQIVTGYFTRDEVAVRVSRARFGVDGAAVTRCKVCIKGPGEEARMELEYDITEAEAHELLFYSPTVLAKTRYYVNGWEVDVMGLGTRLLVVAEWEFGPGKEQLPDPLPDWVGMDITGIKEFTNQALAWKYGKQDKP